MRILNILQLIVCLFATSWLTTAAYRGWKTAPAAGTGSSSGAHYRGSHYSGIYYGGSSYSGGSRSSGGSWGGGK
jgi:hypothetical protein